MSPSDIYHQSSPDPVVSILIFTKRLKKIIAAGGVTDKLIDEALYSSVGNFKRRHATRKTLVNCDGVMLDLQECYRSRCMVDSVKYSNFRSRVVSLQNRNALDSASLDDALRYARADWMSFYGGGRHKSFIYTGCLYADQIGKRFHSVSSFLKTVGRHDERSTIWARLKLGWDLDFALEAPTLYSTTSVGCIYKITRRSTDQIYVGLTFGDVGARWLQHVNSAIKGGKNRLAQAIRQDGPDGFFFVILEDNHKDIEELRSRERYWIKKLNAQGDHGLNSTTGGELGGPKGRKVEYEGEKFPSISEASRVLSVRLGLREHVVRDRLIAGKFLPTRARRNSDHPAAGSPLFRRWLSLLRRYGNRVDAIWIESYDKFAADVSPFDPALKIVPIDSELPIGPDNFSWATSREVVEKTHGKGQIVFGRHFDSLTAIALAFNIKVSTLKYRVFVSGMTFERAVSLPLGETSFRTSGTEIVVDGVVFRSKRQAILHIAKTREISEGVAKYGLSIGRFV